MNIIEIEKFLKEEKEPTFRLKQIKEAVFLKLVKNWDEATNLPEKLRKKLSAHFPIEELKKEKGSISKDKNTIKVLFKLKDGLKIESVLMKYSGGRNTVCVSSQVGCAMDCVFCATGQNKFKRNLTVSEIVGQVLFFARELKKQNERISNVVFMGMGEPFLNYDNCIEAIKTLNDQNGLSIGTRKIAISTSGITEGIEKLADEKIQANLAISLNAPDDNLRSKIMPINNKYPIEKVLKAVNNYIKKTNRKVMFEYIMIKGVNDSLEQAKKLAEVLKPLRKENTMVNLISFNPIKHVDFEPTPQDKIKEFKEVLKTSGIDVSQRFRFGGGIEAACGQLAEKRP